MTKQVINVGSAANDGSGTPARTAFQYVNANFSELYDFLTGTTNATTLPAALPIAKGGTGATTASGARTNLGLGTAAAANIGTAAGNVMEVGAFGIGTTAGGANTFYSNINISNIPAGCYSVSPTATGSPGANGGGNLFAFGSANYQVQLHKQNVKNQLSIRFGTGPDSFTGWGSILISGINTTTDSNGFIKAASPIVKLFADKIELNDEAAEQPIQFEKVEKGDYLLKGSLGFAQEGWYIEVPKDANGNTIVAVVYDTLENGDISIKTYKRKFDFELAAVVADHENPMDIPEGRWIDIRLHEELVVEETLPDDTE
ncbi:TPA: phage tail protein [Acinetobacter baumannii]